MSRTSLIFFAIVAVCVVAGVNAAGAAALPEFLDNVVSNSGTGSIGVSLETLGGGLTIKCTGGTVLVTILTATHLDADLHLRGCSALGAPMNSLGDSSGIVLLTALGLLCYINKTKKEVGVFFEGIKVHDEIPLVGVLLNIEGTVVAKVSATSLNSLKTGSYEIEFAQTSGDPSFQCEGKTASLLSSKDAEHKTTESSGLTGSTKNLTFGQDLEIDA